MGNTTSVSQTQYKYNSWEDFRKLTDKEIQDIDPIDVNPDLFDDSKYSPNTSKIEKRYPELLNIKDSIRNVIQKFKVNSK